MDNYRSNLNRRVAALPLVEMARLLGKSTNPISLLSDRAGLEYARRRFHTYVAFEAAQLDLVGIEDDWRSYLLWIERTHPERLKRFTNDLTEFTQNVDTGRKIENIAVRLIAQNNQRHKGARLSSEELSPVLVKEMEDARMGRDEIMWASASRAKKQGGEGARALIQYTQNNRLGGWANFR